MVYYRVMPEASLGEIYFIVGMMTLVLVISAVSLYLFVKTYKKEMRERDEERRRRQAGTDSSRGDSEESS